MTEINKEEFLAQFLLPERLERIENVLAGRTRALTVVLDSVRNHHNISAVIRSSDAFGLAGIHLVGDSFNFSSGISLGAERWMELTPHQSSGNAIAHLKEQGFKLVALQPEDFPVSGETPKPFPVSQIPFEEKIALVFGNEKQGLTPEFIEAVDYFAFIPMCGFVESLNISVACAIALYASTVTASIPKRRTAILSANEKSELKESWLKRDVKNSDIILREVEMRAKFHEKK